jgi:signal transduction histidine kinase
MLRDFDFDACIINWLNDYAPHGILTTDTAFVIRGWNRWFEQNTGRSADSVMGLSLFEVFPELIERGLDELYRSALDGQITVLAHRFHRYLVKMPALPEYNLPEMQQTARIAPLVSGGQVVGTITSIDDVSERVVRENELLAARESADQANQAKDKFLAVLSHDLRTPLTATAGWARIFQKNPDDEAVIRRGAEVIERNAAIQLQLIEELLDISRISAGKLELSLETVEIRDLVNYALETLEPMAQAKGIVFNQVLPNESRTAVVDAKRFQQIVWNLVSNAIKFTPRCGSISAQLKYFDSDFEFSVEDTGKGINPEALSHVFEPLWQAESSRRQGGLGLGLAIVKNLVELHGGNIRAESLGTGKGASFILNIPWAPGQKQAWRARH